MAWGRNPNHKLTNKTLKVASNLFAVVTTDSIHLFADEEKN
jgi:hypothetical protein